MTVKTLVVTVVTTLVATAAYVWLFGVSENAINAITKPFARK